MNTEIATTQPTEQLNTTTDMVLNYKAMEQMNNLAQLMAQGKTTVPKHLQASPADCMAVIMQAAQWKMNPFAVAQKTHLVNGTLGYEAQLVSAVITSSTAIKGRFHYQYGGEWPNGKDAWVQCGAILAGETEIQWGEPLYIAQVTTKNSPLWKTAPKQQAAYLATKYWARLFAPSVILGVYSTDELEQSRSMRDVTPLRSVNSESKLAQVLESASEPQPEQAALPNKAEELQSFIEDAWNLDDLNQAGQEVANAYKNNQITQEDRKVLGAAFIAKQKELAPAKEAIDTETGEVVNQ